MRLANRLLGFLAALALAAVGVITIVEVIGERARSSGPVLVDWKAMLRWGQHNTWQALSVEVACGITAAVGLILVVLQLRRRRPSRVPLEASDNVAFALTRKGMVNAVRACVLDVEGISKAKVAVHHRRIVVKADSVASTAAETKSYAGAVQDAVTAEMDALHLMRRRRVRVRMQGRREGGDD